MSPALPARSTLFGPSLVVTGLFCQETGASIAVMLFPAVGPAGIVALRLVFSAIILCAVARPSLRGRRPIAWYTAIAFGLVLTGMNLFFYLALDRLPLGTTVTIELLGPLTLSVVAGRRWMNLVWAGLALVGVVLLGGSATHLDPLGVAFTLVAAAFWAGYILLSKATGRHFAGIQGLAVAMVAGSVVTVPIALATTGSRLFGPHVLIAGLGIALLSSVAPYALEMTALRRTPAATFAILLALAPAVAAAAGFFILGQTMTIHDVFGIVAVICASIGAVCTPPGKPGGRQKA
ncbi:EamA family transporter [Propionibacterium freudenreichii]|uniref:Permeases of the drug/metabolite transporter (DMT) superfamily n=2 Tax=Propionibacterium freudenreichii TaxID=1744 RepID=A0A0B7NYQ1_PROFF|nr:EamA family transporter [Propionibacterium freudenreichii]MDN5961339.1 EamA family transporter [Propionibacterium sp.]AJQ90787.1 Inner membrane transporter rhtA [Propionibacterium freudenreichii subsp. freudenreichii]MCT2974000.1 EamA family transporter [Propionibacterium freudenreichii]MCT2975790.1 EamA family transporter [Propionibacterium freudenreichii]MCT2979551.1 EamA family transporter [Propionibacterium freudenreichii]